MSAQHTSSTSGSTSTDHNNTSNTDTDAAVQLQQPELPPKNANMTRSELPPKSIRISVDRGGTFADCYAYVLYVLNSLSYDMRQQAVMRSRLTELQD